MTEHITDLTETIPTMDDSTSKNVVKWAAVGVTATAALLAISNGVKRFRAKKTVKVVVADKPTA